MHASDKGYTHANNNNNIVSKNTPLNRLCLLQFATREEEKSCGPTFVGWVAGTGVICQGEKREREREREEGKIKMII